MPLYAQTPAKRTSQIIGDLIAVAFLVVAVLLAILISGAIRGLAGIGEQMSQLGRDIVGSLNQTGEQLGQVPIVGDQLEAPFTDLATTAQQLVVMGDTQQAITHAIATWTLVVLILIPIGILVLAWLLPRIRGMRRGADTARLAATSAGRDILAIRAVATQPLAALARITGDPVAAIRAGDARVLDELASLELRDAGLRPIAPATPA